MRASRKRILSVLLVGLGLGSLFLWSAWRDKQNSKGAVGRPAPAAVGGGYPLELATDRLRAADDLGHPSRMGANPAGQGSEQSQVQSWWLFDAGRLPERVPVEGAQVSFGADSVATDSAGRLVLPADTSELWIRKTGYLDSRYDLAAIQVSHSAGAPPDRELWLCPSNRLSVEVAWEDGEPVEGALVSFSWSMDRKLLPYGFSGLSYSPVTAAQAKSLQGPRPLGLPKQKELVTAETDEGGRLELDRLPGGYPLTLHVVYGGISERHTFVIRGGAGAHESVQVQLSRGFTVSGSLRPLEQVRQTLPLPPVAVELQWPGKPPISTLSDEAGRFEFKDCPEGWVSLGVSRPYSRLVRTYIDQDIDIGSIDVYLDLPNRYGRLVSRWPIQENVLFVVPSMEARNGMAAGAKSDGRFSIFAPPAQLELCLVDARNDMTPVEGAVFRLEPGVDPFELDIDPWFGLMRIVLPSGSRALSQGPLRVGLQSNQSSDPSFDGLLESRAQERHALIPEGENELILPHVLPGEYTVSLWAGQELVAQWNPVVFSAGKESRCIPRQTRADFAGLVRRLDGGSLLGWRVALSCAGTELASRALSEDGEFLVPQIPAAQVTVAVLDDRGAIRLERLVATEAAGPKVELLVPKPCSLQVICKDHLPAWGSQVSLWSAEPGSRHRRLATVAHGGSSGARFENLAPGRYLVRANGAFEPGIVTSRELTLTAGEEREVLLSGHQGSASVSFLHDTQPLRDVVQCWVKGRLPDGTLVSADLAPSGPGSFRCPAGLSQAMFVFRRSDQGPLPKIGLYPCFYWSIASTRAPIAPGQELLLSAEGETIEFRGESAWCAAAARQVAVVEVHGMSLQNVVGTFTIVPEAVEEGRIRMSPLPRGTVVSVLAGPGLRRQELRLEGPLRLSQDG